MLSCFKGYEATHHCRDFDIDKLNTIPLADNTMKRSVEAISNNKKSCNNGRLSDFPGYVLQMGVSTEGKRYLCFGIYLINAREYDS